MQFDCKEKGQLSMNCVFNYKNNKLSLLVKNILILLAVSLGAWNISVAEVLECQVGDLSNGYWQQPIFFSSCLYPGPPAQSSPWPTGSDQGGRAYRVESRFKIEPMMSAVGSISIPPARPECITGYAEAYAVFASIYYQNLCDSQPVCHTIYTPIGSMCTVHYIDGLNESWNYYRFFEAGVYLYEWRCNTTLQEPVQPIQNQGPPLLPSVNEHTGKECP